MKLYPFKILAVLLCLVFCLCQGSTAFAEDTSLRIPDGVTAIEAEAFFGCQNVSSVTIPASVNEIGNAAFVGCTGLKDVYYGEYLAQAAIDIPAAMRTLGLIDE